MPGPVGKQQPVKGRRSSLCNVVDVTAVITSWGWLGTQASQCPCTGQLTSLPSSTISKQEPSSVFPSQALRRTRMRRTPSPVSPTCALAGAWGTC